MFVPTIVSNSVSLYLPPLHLPPSTPPYSSPYTSQSVTFSPSHLLHFFFSPFSSCPYTVHLLPSSLLSLLLSLLFPQDEAFTLWQTHWGNLYPVGSKSQKMIEHFQNTYYLVNLVDNDYVQGNVLFKVVNDVLERMGKPRRTKTPSPATEEEGDNPQT